MRNSAHLTVAAISRETQIPRRTIQAAITRGDLKATKLGDNTTAYVITQDDLDRWLEQRKEAAS